MFWTVRPRDRELVPWIRREFRDSSLPWFLHFLNAIKSFQHSQCLSVQSECLEQITSVYRFFLRYSAQFCAKVQHTWKITPKFMVSVNSINSWFSSNPSHECAQRDSDQSHFRAVQTADLVLSICTCCSRRFTEPTDQFFSEKFRHQSFVTSVSLFNLEY